MADRTFYDMQGPNVETKVIEGQIQLNASAAVTGVVGIGFTAAKTGTGEYTITLNDRYNALMSCVASIESSSNTVLSADIESHNVNSATPTVVINTAEKAVAGAPTDTAAALNIHFRLGLRNSSVDR